MMQRWRGGGTLELARALAIGRSANHSFGNNRLHTLHTKDTRETTKNCPEWGCCFLRVPTTLSTYGVGQNENYISLRRVVPTKDDFFLPRNLDDLSRRSPCDFLTTLQLFLNIVWIIIYLDNNNFLIFFYITFMLQ